MFYNFIIVLKKSFNTSYLSDCIAGYRYNLLYTIVSFRITIKLRSNKAIVKKKNNDKTNILLIHSIYTGVKNYAKIILDGISKTDILFFSVHVSPICISKSQRFTIENMTNKHLEILKKVANEK